MTPDQADELLTILRAAVVELHGLRKELSSHLEILGVRMATVQGR